MLSELHTALKSEIDIQPLIQVAVRVLGEFQGSESDVLEIIEKLLSMPQTTVNTKCCLLTA